MASVSNIYLHTYASGFSRPYKTDEEEIGALLGETANTRGEGVGTRDPENSSLYWLPSSVDFRTEAAKHSQPIPVMDFPSLISTIQRYKRLEQVWWYGHGSPYGLNFGMGRAFGISNLVSLRNTNLSPHFIKGGMIVFAACNTPLGGDLLQGIANADILRAGPDACGSPNRKVLRLKAIADATCHLVIYRSLLQRIEDSDY